MNLIAALLYDPAIAVTKSTSTLLALTAIDTTNVRLTFTVPSHGKVCVVICVTNATSAALQPLLMLGVLQGSTVKGRVVPMATLSSSTITTYASKQYAKFIVSGLTPGVVLTWDAAYGVEAVASSSNIAYGGPNDATSNNAWGGLRFEIYDPAPIPYNADGSMSASEDLMAYSANTIRTDS